jgi:hypothetical protein
MGGRVFRAGFGNCVERASGAEQAAERGPFEGEIEPRVLRGLKPNIDFIGFIGTTEVMP